MAPDGFDITAWQVDLPGRRVEHDTGFSARICGMPLTEIELRQLNAEGLVAIGTVRGDNGLRWAVMATAESIALAEQAMTRVPPERSMTVSRLAQMAGTAWLRTYLPPQTIDEIRLPRSFNSY